MAWHPSTTFHIRRRLVRTPYAVGARRGGVEKKPKRTPTAVKAIRLALLD